MSDEFYIGWEKQAPAGVGRRARAAALVFLAGAVCLALALAATQRLIGVAVFEWGTVKTFAGILESQPYPRLLVPRPGRRAPEAAFSTYQLVAPFKFGLDPGKLAGLNGREITLRGTLIYRGNQTMIEALPGSIQAAGQPANPRPEPGPMDLGRQTLVGEIVDSKCYYGVMNPGRLTTHRACAIRCISGGIPPVLLVRQREGSAAYYLLVSPEGKPVNRQVLDLVAEPVEITGAVERQGDLLILRADPATYRRL